MKLELDKVIPYLKARRFQKWHLIEQAYGLFSKYWQLNKVTCIKIYQQNYQINKQSLTSKSKPIFQASERYISYFPIIQDKQEIVDSY